jgi:hypothetical protein
MRLPAFRAFLPVLAALGLFGVAAIMSFVGEDPAGPDPRWNRGMDLVSYWAGGTVLAEGDGATLYKTGRTTEGFKALFPPDPPTYPMVYPPPVYQAFAIPQPGISYVSAAKFLLFLAAAAHMAGAAFIVAAVRALRPWRSWALAAAFVLPGAVSVVLSGQLSGFWVLALGGAFYLRSRGRPLAAGAALSVVCLKPTLAAPTLLTFALLAEWQVLAGVVLGGLGILLLSLAGGGADAWLGWVDKMRHPDKVIENIWIRWPRQITLRTLLAQLAPRRAWRNAFGWTGVAAGLALGAWIALPLRRAWLAPSGDADPSGRIGLLPALRAGAVLSALLLATPHLFEYDLGMYLVGMAASLAWILGGHARWPRPGAFLLLLAWLAGLFVEVNPYLHFDLSAISVLGWVVWMAWELKAAELAATAGLSLPPPA